MRSSNESQFTTDASTKLKLVFRVRVDPHMPNLLSSHRTHVGKVHVQFFYMNIPPRAT